MTVSGHWWTQLEKVIHQPGLVLMGSLLLLILQLYKREQLVENIGQVKQDTMNLVFGNMLHGKLTNGSTLIFSDTKLGYSL